MISRERRKIPVRLSGAPLHDAKGALVGFLETVEDIRTSLEGAEGIQNAVSFSQLVGRSPKMKELFQLIPVVAQTDSSLLITGETGTGKDVLAEVIHKASDRSKGAFIKINCGALPETLLESELFGHKKGAFTGAVSDKVGRLRLAHNGTLYLTEIGDLPLPLQVKLLTFLDDKIVYPLGSTGGFQADVRVIAATHRNLEQMVKEGHFRQDLLFRLNVVRFHLPPLRERGKDISLLLDHFLKIFSVRFGKHVKDFSSQVRHLLLGYPYPGNVRELRNIVEYATSICPGGIIESDHIPSYLIGEAGMLDHEKDAPDSKTLVPARWDHQDPRTELNWGAIERRLIIDSLVKANGRRNKAAEMLGWGRTTLWRKMKEYGLEAVESRTALAGDRHPPGK
jgi:transcriptional regulator with PAS, ATPase and Fis domain